MTTAFKRSKILLMLLLALGLMITLATPAQGFNDVRSGDWYADNVTAMTDKGYLKGYPDGSFRPNSAITAAEYVSVVARVSGLDEKPAQNSHWAGGLLQSALEQNWYDWDEIPPTAATYDQPLTRQLAVKITMKAFAPEARGDYNTESAKLTDFSRLSGRYYDTVLAAYSLGIAQGDAMGNFNPTSSLTRAEACALISRGIEKSNYEAPPNINKPTDPPNMQPPTAVATAKGVSKNGHLQVKGTQLCNERGEAIILRGMSTHGIHWFPQFLNKACIKSTADSGANLFRIAMYTAEGGYISNQSLKNQVIKAVDDAISLDMYVIIDWHILYDGNPNTYKAQAKAFFSEMAERYKGNPAVIYEICNEPNGGISWQGDVKPYAEELINTIRAIDSQAVILVGSPTWSQDLHEVAKSPLTADNIMYTCHFYAGTHTDWLRNRISTALQQGLPVFISELGTSYSSGTGGVFTEEANRWLSFLNANQISWANWSLCDKNETSAAVLPGANVADGIQPNELSPSGKWVFSHFND